MPERSGPSMMSQAREIDPPTTTMLAAKSSTLGASALPRLCIGSAIARRAASSPFLARDAMSLTSSATSPARAYRCELPGATPCPPAGGRLSGAGLAGLRVARRDPRAGPLRRRGTWIRRPSPGSRRSSADALRRSRHPLAECKGLGVVDERHATTQRSPQELPRATPRSASNLPTPEKSRCRARSRTDRVVPPPTTTDRLAAATPPRRPARRRARRRCQLRSHRAVHRCRV